MSTSTTYQHQLWQQMSCLANYVSGSLSYYVALGGGDTTRSSKLLAVRQTHGNTKSLSALALNSSTIESCESIISPYTFTSMHVGKQESCTYKYLYMLYRT